MRPVIHAYEFLQVLFTVQVLRYDLMLNMSYVQLYLTVYVETLNIIDLICYYYICIVYCRPLYELYLCVLILNFIR